MTDYLIQQATDEYWPLMLLTNHIHRTYTDRHDLEFVIQCGRLVEDRHIGWDKVEMLLWLVRMPDTGLILWVDADAMAIGHRDPREALPDDYVIGMTRHPGRTTPDTVNAGVIFLRACPQVEEWLMEVQSRAPGVWPWFEQDIMNELLYRPEWEGRYVSLSHVWNSTVIHGHPEECEIRAWHGGGTPVSRFAKMQADILRRGL